MQNKWHSAGGIIVGPEGNIAITNQHGDSWSLPKGHLEPGESVEETALREIQEETGLTDVVILEKLGEYDRPRIGKGGVGDAHDQFKHITLFLCHTKQHILQPEDPDNPEARWVDIGAVTSYLTHQKDKEFFDKCRPKIEEFMASIATDSISSIE